MSGIIQVTYRDAPGSEGQTMTLPLLTEDSVKVEAHIRYPSGEQVVLFSQNDEPGFYEGRSIDTQWPDSVTDDGIDTTHDVRGVTILDRGEGGVFVCRKRMAYPFICVNPDADSPLEIAWLPVDHIEGHMIENDLIFLSDPRSKILLNEAGISVEATAMVHEDELVGREEIVEDFLFDLLDDIETEVNSMGDFVTGNESQFDIGDSGLLAKVHEQVRYLQALREKMNERIKL